MPNVVEYLDNNHWMLEDYKQRVTRKVWREMLLNKQDSIINRGRVRQIKAKNLGLGVYELSKKPIKENQ